MTVTSAQGFVASGVAAGIKASGKLDLALVVNQGPVQVGAAVTTSNRIKAAPVVWTEQVVKDGELHAVALNSGGANACTGPDGFADTHRTAEKVASVLDTGAGEVAVCSTGLIGVRLPMEPLLAGIDTAATELSPDGGSAAAEAIMTTDTVSKVAQTQAAGFTIGGMAKGAGMLAPGMATMLSVITTDANISAQLAAQALKQAVATTFNRVDSDGCMSTNDTVILMASGASGASPDAKTFTAALTAVAADLSKQLVSDAEGSTKDIEVSVINAASEEEAETAARAVTRSSLFKCAIYGEDPNWGRIISAVGTTDVSFEPDQIAVTINGVEVCRNGSVGQDRDLVDMKPREVHVEVNLNAGIAQASVWTNDLTKDYVHENSAYSSLNEPIPERRNTR